MKRIAIGQAGGPTAVINTSLAGFIENLPGDTELYTVENGYEGLAESKIQKADRKRIEKVRFRSMSWFRTIRIYRR